MKPKLLLLDIETAATLAHVWGLFNENIPLQRVLEPGYMLCWSAKWVGEKPIFFKKLVDKDFLTDIHKLLDEADAVIHYNGRRFDIPHINREFLKAGLTPPSPYKQIDLLSVVKKNFKFASNKLEFVVRALGIGEKEDNGGYAIWLGCMANEPKAWKKMETYNRKDVQLLEPLYNMLLPWIPNPLNRGLFNTGSAMVCPSCGSTHVHSRGVARAKTLSYRRYQCQDCGAWSRTKEITTTKTEKSRMMVPV